MIKKFFFHGLVIFVSMGLVKIKSRWEKPMKFRLLAAVAAVVFVLTACGKNEDSAAIQQAAEQRDATLAREKAATVAREKEDAIRRQQMQAEQEKRQQEQAAADEKLVQDVLAEIRDGIPNEKVKVVATANQRRVESLYGVASQFMSSYWGSFGGTPRLEYRTMSQAFWLWAMENPSKMTTLMGQAKIPLRLNADFMTRLRSAEGFLKKPYKPADVAKILAACDGKGQENGLSSEGCRALAATSGGALTEDTLYVINWLARRHNAGGVPYAEKFRAYALELLNPK